MYQAVSGRIRLIQLYQAQIDILVLYQADTPPVQFASGTYGSFVFIRVIGFIQFLRNFSPARNDPRPDLRTNALNMSHVTVECKMEWSLFV